MSVYKELKEYFKSHTKEEVLAAWEEIQKEEDAKNSVNGIARKDDSMLFEEWEDCEIDLTTCKPFKEGASCHVDEYRYKVDNRIYRELMFVGDDTPVVQRLVYEYDTKGYEKKYL